MTEVTLLRDGAGSLCGYECRGHAGYAEEGSDIVCAAVSVLSTTCANALESVAGAQPAVSVDEGFLKVTLPQGTRNHDAQVILRVFAQGIGDIAASYPQYIRILRP